MGKYLYALEWYYFKYTYFFWRARIREGYVGLWLIDITHGHAVRCVHFCLQKGTVSRKELKELGEKKMQGT